MFKVFKKCKIIKCLARTWKDYTKETWHFKAHIWSGGIYFYKLAGQDCRWDYKWSQSKGQHHGLP
jgi:hypothetical protein